MACSLSIKPKGKSCCFSTLSCDKLTKVFELDNGVKLFQLVGSFKEQHLYTGITDNYQH